MTPFALLALLAACSSSTEPFRVELGAEEHHGQTFSTLEVHFRDPVLTQRLDGVTAKVHARCLGAGRVFEDEVEPLAPMIASEIDPHLVHTTDDLEVRLFAYALRPLFGVPDRCDVAVTTRRRGDAKPAVLAEICLHADRAVSVGRCAP